MYVCLGSGEYTTEHSPPLENEARIQVGSWDMKQSQNSLTCLSLYVRSTMEQRCVAKKIKKNNKNVYVMLNCNKVIATV
jgi:hypothetical protein